MYISARNQRKRRIHSHWGNLIVAGRVTVTVAVVPLLAVGLQGRVAKVLEKAWLQAGDLALVGRAWNCRSPELAHAACCLLLLDLVVAGSAMGEAHGCKEGEEKR